MAFDAINYAASHCYTILSEQSIFGTGWLYISNHENN
jgi:hypothetical protein